MIIRAVFAVSYVLLASCTWVELNEEAEGVGLLSQDEFDLRKDDCRKVGSAQVSVLDKVLLERSSEKVSEELTTLARNQAAGRGNVIVATTDVTDGAREYDIYQCSK